MIFVTVGTHEQQFDRLLRGIDQLKGEEKIVDEVIVQTGFSTYIPKNCIFKKFYSYDEMDKLISQARIVITHGGPASFMNVISKGKNPIIVPRLVEFKEHVNNHQLDFAKKMISEKYPVILLEDINEMEEALNKVEDMNTDVESNNLAFIEKFSQIILELNGGKK